MLSSALLKGPFAESNPEFPVQRRMCQSADHRSLLFDCLAHSRELISVFGQGLVFDLDWGLNFGGCSAFPGQVDFLAAVETLLANRTEGGER